MSVKQDLSAGCGFVSVLERLYSAMVLRINYVYSKNAGRTYLLRVWLNNDKSHCAKQDSLVHRLIPI